MAELSWERPLEATCRGPYSLIIGADLVYAAADVKPLLATVEAVQRLNPTCALLMAHCARNSAIDEELMEELSGAGLSLLAVANSERDRRVSVYQSAGM